MKIAYDQHLLAWGDNEQGQLGIGTNQDCFTPLPYAPEEFLSFNHSKINEVIALGGQAVVSDLVLSKINGIIKCLVYYRNQLNREIRQDERAYLKRKVRPFF